MLRFQGTATVGDAVTVGGVVVTVEAVPVLVA